MYGRLSSMAKILSSRSSTEGMAAMEGRRAVVAEGRSLEGEVEEEEEEEGSMVVKEGRNSRNYQCDRYQRKA